MAEKKKKQTGKQKAASKVKAYLKTQKSLTKAKKKRSK